MILYQYRGQIGSDVGFKYLESLIQSGEMMFSKPSEFNDPFDCCPTQVHEVPEGAFPHAVGNMLNKTIQEAMSTVCGVACFTPYPDKMLMWSHYGDQHRSVCVGFDTQLLIDNVPKNSEGNPLYNEIEKVKYTEIRPSAESKNALNQKSLEWIHEDEYRIISHMKKGTPTWGPGVWRIPTLAIKEIIIGARVTKHMQDKIIHLVQSANKNVAIKKAVLHMHKYKIIIEELSDQPQVAPMSGFLLDPNEKWREIGHRHI